MEITRAHLTRQLDLIPWDKVEETQVNVIGAGAVGSYLVLNLAKMGFRKIKVWDFDEVSVENMSCQMYRFRDIGKSKVEALRELVEDFTGVEIEAVNNKWTPDAGELTGLVVAAADCMAVRRQIWNHVRRTSPNVRLVIDPRMGAEFASLFMTDPNNKEDIERYKTTFYSNEEAVQERCTAKATVYTASLLAGLIAKGIKNWVCSQEYPKMAHWDIASSKPGSLFM